MNLLQVFEQGNFILCATFILLLGMSVASWYIIFWKAWMVRIERKFLASFKRNKITTADWSLRLKEVKSNHGGVGYLAEQLHLAQQEITNSNIAEQKEILSLHFAQALDNLKTCMDKGLTVLASIGSSAPFIGLFGTVYGIYGALIKISAEGNASISIVAGPMGEALIATAVGLFAAIPAVLAYNAFVRVNRLLIQDYRHIAEQITMCITKEKNN